MEEARTPADQPNVTARRITLHPDLHLLELAERNPSPGGRELLREIIERGNRSATNDAPAPRDLPAALLPRSLDDSAYRTPVEQASQLQQESPALRDLYEHGATVKGATLILPAAAHELSGDRAAPLLTTLAYAQQKLPDAAQAKEFYDLAKTISGTTADARTELTVFKIYYDRLARDERGERIGKGAAASQQQAATRTLAEMRELAREMALLETRESVELAPEFAAATERANATFNQAARTVDLRDEALRWPAGLSAATKERLLTKTLPELDYRLERGVPRSELNRAIDRTMTRPDAEVSQAERTDIGSFLKHYLAERLRDPETRAAHTSPAFRAAREAFWQAQTPAEVSRVATEFYRMQREREQAARLPQADPVQPPPPSVKPLDLRERNLLFYGRAPAHYTSAMRELRIAYGLSQAERQERVAQLRAGRLPPSPPLQTLLDELATRRTAKAVSHFQASLLNEQLQQPNRQNLFALKEQLPPHERMYLYELTTQRKEAWQTPERAPVIAPLRAAATTARAIGELPRQSASLREYLAHRGRIERQLLNDALQRREPDTPRREPLTITEARQRLPEVVAQALREQASQLAWERLLPPEIREPHPSEAAQRVAATVVQLRDELQAGARLAQSFHEEGRPAAAAHEPANARQIAERQTATARFAVEAREAFYRGFELLDERVERLRAERQALRVDRQSPNASMLTAARAAQAAAPPLNGAPTAWYFDRLRDTLEERLTSVVPVTIPAREPESVHELER